MKLEEGYVKCSVCNGTGEDGIYVCLKCQGKGFTDWITNAMFREKPLSVLSSLNVKRMVMYVRQTIEKALEENIFQPIELPIKAIESHLDHFKSTRALYDYKVSDYYGPPNNRHINITIKPMRSIEMIEMKFVVNRSD